MKKKIVILAGGYSKEREISLNSGKEVYKSIKNKYICYLIDPKGDLNQVLKKLKPDIVFNGLHGRYGEDGYIQSILENEKIKYTHSGVLSSFLAMDKYLSKKIFKENNWPTIDVTRKSVEETAASVIKIYEIKNKKNA